MGILAYQTIETIGTLQGAALALLSGLLVLRCIWDVMKALEDPEIGLKEALRKIKLRIFATVIAICSSAYVTYFKSFY